MSKIIAVLIHAPKVVKSFIVYGIAVGRYDRYYNERKENELFAKKLFKAQLAADQDFENSINTLKKEWKKPPLISRIKDRIKTML